MKELEAKKIHSWKKRWFVLGPEQLKYYMKSDKADLKGYFLIPDLLNIERSVFVWQKFWLYSYVNLNICAGQG